MQKSTFQLRALAAVRHELEKGAIPLERIRAFAAAALDLGVAHPDVIPADALAAIAKAHPEFSAVAGDAV